MAGMDMLCSDKTGTLTLNKTHIHACMHVSIYTYIHVYSAIEEMAGMDMLCSDKTGTLTLNKMVIQDDCPTYTQVSMYACIYVCVCVYVYASLCMHICIHACMCTWDFSR